MRMLLRMKWQKRRCRCGNSLRTDVHDQYALAASDCEIDGWVHSAASPEGRKIEKCQSREAILKKQAFNTERHSQSRMTLNESFNLSPSLAAEKAMTFSSESESFKQEWFSRAWRECFFHAFDQQDTKEYLNQRST